MKDKVLKLLESNSRISFEEMAVMLDCSVEEITEIVKELEENRIILQYTTVINREKCGEDIVTALIEVNVTPQREVGFDVVAERIYRFPEVRAVSLMSGRYDLAVFIEGKCLKEIAFFVSEKLTTIEYVQSTRTHFVLKKYKEAGVIFEDKEKDRRQVISP